MTPRTLLAALPALLLLGSSAAWAVGDLPQRMTRAQVAASYASIRPLLTGDAMTCPVGQQPLSGVTTGGASPGGGRQQIVLTFSKGATVTIVRTWDRFPKRQMTVTISCSS